MFTMFTPEPQLKSVQSSGAKNLAIRHHKKLLYLFYLLTLQNI